jgi:hypothetical protein
MKTKIFAAVFALLASAAPAYAAHVDAISLTFDSDAHFTGTVTFNGDYSIVTEAGGTLTGPGLAGPYSPTPATLGLSSDGLYPGAPSLGGPYYEVMLDGTGPLGFYTDLIVFVYSVKNGSPVLFEPDAGVAYWDSVLGVDRSTSGSLNSLNPVPLPAALPLFGSAMIALAGLAWRSRGKVS